MQNEVMYELKVENAVVHLSEGNSKIGRMLNFSTLPGDANHMVAAKGQKLTNVVGTCSDNCEHCFNHCYAVNSCQRYSSSVIPAWGENTLLLRKDPKIIFDAVDAHITKVNTSKRTKNKIKFYRHNVSGELQTLQELELLNELALKHPEVRCGIYSKNYDVVDQFLTKHGESAANLSINISQWHHCADKFLEKWAGKVNVFEYDDSNRKWCTMSEEDKARVAKCRHCKAVLQNGDHAKNPDGTDVTCDGCMYCYVKSGLTTCVYDH